MKHFILIARDLVKFSGMFFVCFNVFLHSSFICVIYFDSVNTAVALIRRSVVHLPLQFFNPCCPVEHNRIYMGNKNNCH